ncbi:class B sortase [Clostridium sp. AL.422]|uniref:class B sortase n=1 Tax=Clostridium TaxID=1485 RepID=UPI00293DE052|nr:MULTISPECIES: class B sortase [unclassified Clostridium]MDV4149832.1 class B sortase [Clostridium sp. AL.422]
MRFSKIFLRVSNALVTLIVISLLCTAGAYSVYALWDNQHIYEEAENVQDDMLEFKPEMDDSVDRMDSFKKLLAINPDVCAWLTMDNTNIDYPVVHGETNLTYINTDVYGDFSLAGSIYEDSRCDADFHDKYNLLYGHHMANHKMFGDLDLYKEKEFFNKNKTGTLILPDRGYDLKVYAYLLVGASEDMIFETAQRNEDINSLHNYVEKNAIYLHKDTFEEAKKANTQILALTTCSSEFTDARTIILAVMEPHMPAE